MVEQESQEFPILDVTEKMMNQYKNLSFPVSQSLLHRFIKDLPLGLHLVYKPNQSYLHQVFGFIVEV